LETEFLDCCNAKATSAIGQFETIRHFGGMAAFSESGHRLIVAAALAATRGAFDTGQNRTLPRRRPRPMN
jgi:hypothetical protein